MKILITRDTNQAGKLRKQLEAIGAEVLCVPTISIQDPESWELFDAAAQQIDQYDWAIFTSANAVFQTHKRLKQLEADDTTFQTLKKAAVGNQTAAAITSVGWSVDLVPEQFQAEGLLDGLLKLGVQDKAIFFPRAAKARNFLIKELQQAGAKVDLVPVYENVIPMENHNDLKEALLEGKPDWITFTSSSTVSNFFAILGETRNRLILPKLASIGSLTTDTLRQFGMEPTFTASPQNLEGLSQGILDWEAENHD